MGWSVCWTALLVCTCLAALCINDVLGQCTGTGGSCQNGGTCNLQTDMCDCPAMYVGPTCSDINLCEVTTNPPCQNGGTCDPMRNGTCICAQPFTGPYCESSVSEDPCNSDPCQNGGTCTSTGGVVSCYCRNDFTGSFCESSVVSEDPCNSHPCMNGGTCISSGGVLSCYCRNDFSGTFCESSVGEDPCNSNPCMNGGSCISSGGMLSCYCRNDFTGTFCESPVSEDPCNSDPCLNGGTCTSSGGVVSCYCRPARSGRFCKYLRNFDTCFEGLCNNGSCIQETSDQVYCDCEPFLRGAFCERYKNCADGSPCLHGGRCVNEGQGVRVTCDCNDQYEGDICEVPISCQPMNPCRNGGRCSDEAAGVVCDCSNTDYVGPTCEEEDPCMSFPCLNDGTCHLDDNQEIFCECPDFFDGSFCEEELPTPCSSDPCLNGGICTDTDSGDFECDCPADFTGDTCQNEMPPASNALSTTTIGIIAGAASGAVVIIVLIIVVACCCCRRQQQSQDKELFALETGVQKRRASHDYTPAPQLKPAIPNLRLSEARKGQNVEFPRNRLTILTKLGSGSFAEVYKAEAIGILKENTKSVVAVKMLKATATENDKSDLSKELSLYMYLDPHPNIVNVLGCCTESDPWYLIMEYLPNGNLQGYLRQIRTGESSAPEYKNIRKMTNIPPNDLLTFGVQIARGMEYLASKACIHRDLATRNVLLGDGMVCKVSDFGLARDLEDGQTYEMKSQGRVPVRWMSPESLLHNTYTSQSDVWSFGILLWEVVTLGSHPYPGMSSKQVVKEISVGYRLPKPDHCSQEIYDMMTECWQHDPNDRPTFAKLRNRLENMLADAAGYLEMSDFNDDNYLYLEPDQQSQETAEGEFLSPA